jgi:hypothetical protein
VLRLQSVQSSGKPATDLVIYRNGSNKVRQKRRRTAAPPAAAAASVCGQIKECTPSHTSSKPIARDQTLRILHRTTELSSTEKKLMEPRFLPALSKMHKIFLAVSRELRTPVNHALIGGLSVAAWGMVRATEDLDFLADSDPSPIGDLNLRDLLRGSLERQRCRVEWRVGDHDDPVPLLLRIDLPRSYGGLSADVLWAHKRWQREALTRTVTVSVSRLRVRVLHPEDLILLKLDAAGPQDLLDVQALLADPPQQLKLARLKETAARTRLGHVLEQCLRAISGNQ